MMIHDILNAFSREKRNRAKLNMRESIVFARSHHIIFFVPETLNTTKRIFLPRYFLSSG